MSMREFYLPTSSSIEGIALLIIHYPASANFNSRKINIWSSFVILSPYFGPLLAAFMMTKLEWQWPFGIYTIETGLCLIAVILFMDETYYNRRIPIDEQPKRRSRLLRLIGMEQWKSRHQRSTFPQAVMRLIKVASKPTVILSWFYYLVTFAWVVGINTTLSIFVSKLYGFGTKQIG
jgi:MFS family permease